MFLNKKQTTESKILQKKKILYMTAYETKPTQHTKYNLHEVILIEIENHTVVLLFFVEATE